LERDEAGAGQDAASAAAEVLGAAVPRGNMGQCDGAVKAGVLQDAEAYTWARIASAIAQWCAPRRRQQEGRRDSSLARSVVVSGPKPNRSINSHASVRCMLL